jgi:GTP 3',8-cyclase
MAEIIPVSGFNDRVRLADVLPLKTPFTLNVFPTNLCNFRCIYCAQSQGTAHLQKKYGMGKDSMSLDIMQKIVDQCREFPEKLKLVSFMGHGEPLLNKLLPDMVSLVHNASIAERIEIITNASLLTHNISDALISAGLTNLRISLQGVNGESYRQICGKKIDYPALLEEIQYYYCHKKNGGVFVKVMDIALADEEEQIFFTQFDGICDRMFVEKVKPVYRGVEIGKKADLTTDRYGNVHNRRKICPLPFFSMSVWPNGDVSACDAIYKPAILGNVNDDSLMSMWTGEKRRKFLLEHLKSRKWFLPGCSDCCAPDDVSHPLDVLDDDAEWLLDLFRL